VRRAPLTASRTFGKLSLRDIAVAEGLTTPPADLETIPDAAQVSAAFQDSDEETLTEIAQATAQSLADVEAISAAFDEHTPGDGPNLDPLLDLLRDANARLRAATGAVDEDTSDDAEGDADQSGAAAPHAASPMVGGGGGAINSPTDVQNALDRIIAYYERCEPSSPLPILLQRAKKLVNADFLTIVKNIAPDGIDNVHLIGGIEEDEDEYFTRLAGSLCKRVAGSAKTMPLNQTAAKIRRRRQQGCPGVLRNSLRATVRRVCRSNTMSSYTAPKRRYSCPS